MLFSLSGGVAILALGNPARPLAHAPEALLKVMIHLSTRKSAAEEELEASAAAAAEMEIPA